MLVLAGTRSGKTAFAPWWLWREIKAKGPGDYLVAAPNYPLLEKAAYSYLLDAFSTKLGIGKSNGGAKGRIEITKAGERELWGADQDRPTRIMFGHADAPESLEAAQYKAAWLDEAGQKQFKRESWEAIQRRLAIDKGRAIFTTTPYSLNWLKTEVYDRAKRVEDAKAKKLPFAAIDADYEAVNFISIDNPAFPLDEWERARGTMQPWKFNLFYMGIFTRPAGAVFDCFDRDTMVCRSFVIPEHWVRYTGVDFGYPNHSTVYVAEEVSQIEQEGQPQRLFNTGRFHVYREYRPQESRQASEHVKYMQRGEIRLPEYSVGGAMSEQNWRDQFAAHGYPIHEPDQRDVEVSLDRTYQLLAEGRLIVHESCPRLIEELMTFSRVVDDAGDVTNDLDDEPSYHGIASLRYLCSYLLRTGPAVDVFF